MMKHKVIIFFLSLLFYFFISSSNNLYAQCTVGTPSFTINLSGKADSVWTSPSTSRGGSCCSTSDCINFNLTLDSMSSGIKIEIATGAIPPGALTYNISCSGSYNFGQEICLSGVGPHAITFCKPGNNQNTYRITAIPKPNLLGKLVINESCTGLLCAVGFIDSTITWQSLTNNLTYNSYLSCNKGCDTTYVTPGATHPNTIDYKVCGTMMGNCANTYTCDSATMQFVSNIAVNITPENPTVCYGQPSTTITAVASGGAAPYKYSWSTGETTSSIQKNAGTYIVSLTDSLNCMERKDTVTITSFVAPIKANAGNDTTLCNNRNQINLSGSIQTASGGIWQGGNGQYGYAQSQLNNIYYATSTERNSDSLLLKLITTGNGSCAADTDFIVIHFNPTPSTTLNLDTNACMGKTYLYTTNNLSNSSRIWSVGNGVLDGSNTDTLVTVKWNQISTGTISIKQSYANGCDSTISKTMHLYSKPPQKTIIHE